jgi:hypothetical protein
VTALYGGGSRAGRARERRDGVIGDVRAQVWQVWRLECELVGYFFRMVQCAQPDLSCIAFCPPHLHPGGAIGRLAGVPVLVAGRRSLSNHKAGKPVMRLLER